MQKTCHEVLDEIGRSDDKLLAVKKRIRKDCFK